MYSVGVQTNINSIIWSPEYTIACGFVSLYSEEYCSALAFETEVSCSRSTKWILCDNLRLAPFQNKPKCQSALACDDSRQTKPISSRVRNAFLMLSISLSLGKRQDCTQCCNDLETDCHERRCLYHEFASHAGQVRSRSLLCLS